MEGTLLPLFINNTLHWFGDVGKAVWSHQLSGIFLSFIGNIWLCLLPNKNHQLRACEVYAYSISGNLLIADGVVGLEQNA